LLARDGSEWHALDERSSTVCLRTFSVLLSATAHKRPQASGPPPLLTPCQHIITLCRWSAWFVCPPMQPRSKRATAHNKCDIAARVECHVSMARSLHRSLAFPWPRSPHGSRWISLIGPSSPPLSLPLLWIRRICAYAGLRTASRDTCKCSSQAQKRQERRVPSCSFESAAAFPAYGVFRCSACSSLLNLGSLILCAPKGFRGNRCTGRAG